MKKSGYMIVWFLWVALILAVQPTFAGSGKFYIVGMGTVPDLLTLRGAEVIKNSQIVMLEGDRDRKAWERIYRTKRSLDCAEFRTALFRP